MNKLNDLNFEIECISGTRKVINNQSEAEIQLWSTKDDITDGEKALAFLKSGLPQQKLWSLQNLDKFIAENPVEIFGFIKSQVLDDKWDLEMIKTLGQGLASAFSLIIVPEILHDEILDICCLFLSSLHKDVYEIWIFVFSCVVSSTNLEEIIEKSVNFVINLSDFNQKSIFRQISCKLLLVLANKLKSEFEGGLFVRARALSQDTDSEVRLEMCLTWVSICSFKAQTDIQEIIFLELQKLIEDEVKLVKAESIVCLIKIIPLFTKEFIQNNVIKLVKHHIFNDISIEIQLKISEYIGELLTNIKDHISNPIREIIIKSLVGLQDGDLTVKKNLVSNLPTIFSVLGSCENLKDMLIKLANDEETSIQVLLASKLHEINKSDYYCQIISYISQKFLETSETYGNIIRNLSWWVYRLSQATLIPKIIMLITTGAWRLQLEYLKVLDENISKFHIKLILNHVVFLLIHKMQEGVWEIKLISAKLLANIIYNTHYTARKLDIINTIKEKFFKSPSCHDRLIFLCFCEFSMSFQSKEFFAKNYWDDLLKFTKDPIMSVRLKLTLLLPLIREVILDQLIFQVENLTEVLIEDSSGYVKNTAKYSQKIMKSDEFIKRIYSDEHAADFNHRQIFEDEQNRQDLKESEDDKRSMVIEIACKAREALRQKRREKSATEILHFKSKSLSGQVCKLPKLVKPNFSLRSGSSSRKKKIS